MNDEVKCSVLGSSLCGVRQGRPLDAFLVDVGHAGRSNGFGPLSYGLFHEKSLKGLAQGNRTSRLVRN